MLLAVLIVNEIREADFCCVLAKLVCPQDSPVNSKEFTANEIHRICENIHMDLLVERRLAILNHCIDLGFVYKGSHQSMTTPDERREVEYYLETPAP